MIPDLIVAVTLRTAVPRPAVVVAAAADDVSISPSMSSTMTTRPILEMPPLVAVLLLLLALLALQTPVRLRLP
jgi:hypothetical protein